MAEIVNDNRLTLILTQHGLNRIAEAILDPTLSIEITNIRLGSGNNYEYYTPSEYQTELMGDLGLSFPVIEKALLEDNVTVSFRAIIPENVGNFDIREVGLYENYNGTETLFAISTQQPFVKPSLNFGYVISIDYYIFLKTVNVAQVYDQIILNPETSLVTDADLEIFMNTILFNHGNMLNQIGNNSRIIGYNRATQLYENIEKNTQTYNYIATYKNYASLLNIQTSESNVLSYWVFDYSRNHGLIQDLGPNEIDLFGNKSMLSYNKEYIGFMPTLAFTSADYFYTNSTTIKLTEEFTAIFALEPLNISTTRTLLAQSNYSNNKHAFEIKENSDGSVEMTLFTDSSNYVKFKTTENVIPNSPHSLIISYPGISGTTYAYINGIQYEMSKTMTGTYTGISSQNISTNSCIINNEGNPIETINSKVGIVALIKNSCWTSASARMFTRLLEATMGRNPYLNRR